ncbi:MULTISPECIES: hypothetical protein [unclassified Mesorhizobium]|uniref:hypothetical protein n=1 Tax=unclassified Mesorhizobium TaxID=325217 RepID=UPI0004CF2189|nr:MULTISPECIES: hypothetical protein [unclassified Mesorhizobium]WJI84404.1 hypothetical protein NLY34_22440 [Mesorhizobium sp. C374B]WJI90461.1 hypothetical protein NLY42_24835 [Mesorhizobium sp. C372A]
MTTEHMPTDAYFLLRRVVSNGPQKSRGDKVDDDSARGFLVSRGFVTWDETAKKLTATQAGRDFGRLMKKAP